MTQTEPADSVTDTCGGGWSPPPASTKSNTAVATPARREFRSRPFDGVTEGDP